jgi:hypothetical protein
MSLQRCASGRCLGHAAALIGMSIAASAHAGVSCVSSLADLKTALALAKDQATTVEVVQGTYDLKTTSWGGNLAQLHNGSSVLGGYTGANCSGRNIDVDNTTFTDSDTTVANVQVLGDATIEGITFKLPYGLQVSSGSAGGGELLFRRDKFTGTNKAVDGALYIQWGPAPNAVIRIVDTLIVGNTSSKADSAAIKIIEEDGSPKVELVNNTIMDNGGQMYGVYIDEYDSTQVYAYNNIFYGNAGTDFKVTGSTKTVLVDNVIGHFSYPVPDTAPIGTTHGDPQLDANYKPVEAPASNVINSGTDDVIGGLPSTDLPGRAREVGSEPDRGAYESSINDSTILQVTNDNDSGPGSLRAAILSSNATGTGTIISFAIGSGCGPQKITLQTALPTISHETHILGYTQTGASTNTLDTGDNAKICVILDGDTHSVGTGLDIATGTLGGAVSVSGLAFSGFTTSAIIVASGFGHHITGIQVGGSVGAQHLAASSNGIVLAQQVSDITLGTSDDADRNQIGGVVNSAIQIDAASQFFGAAASNNQVINNYIGMVDNGTTVTRSASYQTGVFVGGPGNDIEQNYIGGAVRGVWIETADAKNNTVGVNVIGVDSGFYGFANGTGIYIESGAGDNLIRNNFIFDSTANGVTVTGTGVHNKIVDNSMDGNAGLDIDLGNDGVTANDNDSTQSSGQPNRKQNYPMLVSATGGHLKGQVKGSLTSTPGTYTIQIYSTPACNASGHGNGYLLAATSTVTINSGGLVDGQGTAQFDITAFGYLGIDSDLTATAIDASGNTSEFSACILYVDDTIFANGFDD